MRRGLIQAGDAAPHFTLFNHAGERVSLADLTGERLVLFFYPKADTPG